MLYATLSPSPRSMRLAIWVKNIQLLNLFYAQLSPRCHYRSESHGDGAGSTAGNGWDHRTRKSQSISIFCAATRSPCVHCKRIVNRFLEGVGTTTISRETISAFSSDRHKSKMHWNRVQLLPGIVLAARLIVVSKVSAVGEKTHLEKRRFMADSFVPSRFAPLHSDDLFAICSIRWWWIIITIELITQNAIIHHNGGCLSASIVSTKRCETKEMNLNRFEWRNWK